MWVKHLSSLQFLSYAAFLERGYTLERLLADFGDTSAERSLVMEKVF